LERPDPRLLRLAELVMHLTDCRADQAWQAIGDAVTARGYPEDQQACMARVARAMVSLRAGVDLRTRT
jgi:hypothetical protein